MSDKDFYTPQQISEQLNVNYRTILREIQRGRLQAKKVGRMYLVTHEALDEYISQGITVQPLRVSAAVVQKGDMILLVRRKKKEGKLFWQFPAGVVRYSERTSTRAEIECLLETGVHCKAVRKFGERIHPDTKAVIAYWLCEYLTGEAYNADTFENAEVEWVHRSNVVGMFTSDTYQPVQRYLEE